MSNNNNNNNNQIANEPPEEDGGAVPVAETGGGVRVSSDDAANSSEYPESEHEGESPSHGSSDAGSKTGRGHDDHEGSGGGVGDRDDDSAQKPPAGKTHKKSDAANEHSGEPNEPSRERDPTFPVKLHRILSNPEHEEIITWLPHGRSWRINNSSRFEQEVLPLYFKHGRYSSFARQVNGWGFKRVMQGSDYNSYYHELFLRNLPHLCERMRRLTTKDIANRKMDNSAVPDFYSLSRDHPLDGTADDRDHSPPAGVAAAAARGKTVRRAVDHTPSSVTAVKAVPRKMPAIPMRMELQMLEKRRKEIVDRIAFLAANLGQSDPSDKHPSPATSTAVAYSNGPGLHASIFNGGGGGHLANPAAAAAAASQPCGGGIVGALTQEGMFSLLRQPGGAQLLAQLAQGLQNNRQNNHQSQAISAPPPASNLNPLLSIPGGIQLFQHLMSSNKSSNSQTSLQVSASAPVPVAPQMGEAQLLLERLMQVTSPVQAPHLSPPAFSAPPPIAGLPMAFLQMLSAAQQQQAPPSTSMHASMSNMPQTNSNNTNFGANGPNAILLQMLTNAAAAAAAAPSAPPPPPVQPLFVPSSTGQNNNVSDAAAMMQQLLQNGNLDLASLLSMSHASLNPQDKKRGN